MNGSNDETDAAIEFKVGVEGATFVEPGESSVGVSRTEGEGETLECTSPREQSSSHIIHSCIDITLPAFLCFEKSPILINLQEIPAPVLLRGKFAE